MSEEKLAPDRTLAGYDRWASSYDHVANPLVAATAWVMDRVPLDVRGRDVLELGCGTGRNALRVLAEGAARYTGVDGSEGMLAVARERIADPRAAWIVAELHDGWQPPRVFDLAFVVLVLEHLQALEPLVRTLAMAKRIRIVDLHPERIAAGAVAHFAEGGTAVVFPSIAHDVEQLERLLDGAGFDVGVKSWHATDELVAAVPKLAKYAGQPIVLDVSATKR